MYEKCFNLNSRPFTSTPYVKHYFAAQSIQQSLASARLCIDRGSGPVIVIGEAGTGKSLLLAMLEEQYRAQFSVANLACARLDERQELLQSILFELQLPYRKMSEGELRLSLMDFLKPGPACPNGVLLLVDEAHNLPTELLDEIRLITNYVRDGQPRVRLVMAGNQRLEDSLNNPRLESFNQRIASRCYLSRMSQEETGAYVTTHIDRSGGDGQQMFPVSTLRVIHKLSDGCPRFVNQICDQAMILAATRGQKSIDDSCVSEAWGDVQNLPGMVGPATQSNSASLNQDESWTVIEFGNLDDDEEDNSNATVYDFENSSARIGLRNEDLRIGNVENVERDLNANAIRSDIHQPDSEPANLEQYSHAEGEEAHQLDQFQPSQIETFEQRSTWERKPNAAGFDNPFDEEFDNEEVVIDEYGPLVAAQNKSSLSVTSQDLELIRPLDSDETVDESQQEPTSKSPGASESSDGLTSGHEAVAKMKKYHEHITEPSSEEIERQAEEILKSISQFHAPVSCETGPDPDCRDGSLDRKKSSSQAAISLAKNAASSHDEFDDEGLLESQRMLQEIIEENNRRAVSSFAGSQPVESDRDDERLADYMKSVEYSPSSLKGIADGSKADEPHDDRDMIIVSHNVETGDTHSLHRREEPIPFPATAISTGQAKRMDYQQLFEQLRSISQD